MSRCLKVVTIHLLLDLQSSDKEMSDVAQESHRCENSPQVTQEVKQAVNDAPLVTLQIRKPDLYVKHLGLLHWR